MEVLTQKILKKMILTSYQRVAEEEEEINKINIFPVPDQDTGTNLKATLKGIKEAIENKEFKDLKELSENILEGAISSAQGNAGVIFTGFLIGFFSKLDKNPANSTTLSLAFQEGQERAKNSIQEPKEGTILDVITAFSQTFKKEAEREKDIIILFKKSIEKAKEALLLTKEKMEILKKANLVDAGGLGFLIILEGYLEALGQKEERLKREEMLTEIKRFIQILPFRYEIVALISNPKIEEKEIKERLKKFGNCLDIVQFGNQMKIHIHTDWPEEVKEEIIKMGQVQNLREEDMAKEVTGEESVKRVKIGLVVEEIVGLLPKILERYEMEIVKIKVSWPEGENLPADNIYQKMRMAEKFGIKSWPKTSQPNPQDYLVAFEKQLKKFEKVLAITLSSKLSGCYNSATLAKEQSREKEKIFVLDSRNAICGQALLVLKSIELIQEGREISEILKELKKRIPKTYLYIAFDDPKWIELSGRISSFQVKWIRGMKKARLHPLLEIKNGKVGRGGIIFAKDPTEALFKKILKESEKFRKKGQKIRVVIQEADNQEGAEKLKEILKEKLKAEVSFISQVHPIVGAFTGPGSLFVAWTPLE